MEQLSKGDIVRSPRGYLARVNWHKDGMIGCSFIDAQLPFLACMTYSESEVFVVKRGPQQFWKEMFKQISDEELRNEIKRDREVRAQVPKAKEQAVRKRDNTMKLLKDLTQEDQEALIRMLRERGRVRDEQV